MDNDQIRLSLLCQYYRAMYNGKGYGQLEENPELVNIPDPIMTANLSYLVDKRLINGEKTYVSGGVIVTTSDITAWGMDVVENILNKTLDQLDQKVSSEINKEESTNKKLDKFYEICVNVQPMYDIAVKVAGLVFQHL